MRLSFISFLVPYKRGSISLNKWSIGYKICKLKEIDFLTIYLFQNNVIKAEEEGG